MLWSVQFLDLITIVDAQLRGGVCGAAIGRQFDLKLVINLGHSCKSYNG